MNTLNISLPEAMHQFVGSQVAEGDYGSASEFIQALIREAQKRSAKESVEALLREGLDSGEPIGVTPEYWDEKHRRLTSRQGEVNGS